MLTTAKEPYEEIVTREVVKNLLPARFGWEDTGDFETVDVDDGEGGVKPVKKPVKRKVMLQAKTETVEQQCVQWVVETTGVYGTDFHYFDDEQSAQRFYGGFN